MKYLGLFLFFLVLVPSALAETRIFHTGPYITEQRDAYEVIYTPETMLISQIGNLEEPVGRVKYEFPQGTVIKDITILWKESYQDLTLNIPEVDWDIDQSPLYLDRTCDSNSRDIFVDYGLPIYSDKTYIEVDIFPLEVVDCLQGKFRLWEKISLDFEIEDKNHFAVESKSDILPGRTAIFNLVFDRVPSGEVLVEGTYGEVGLFKVMSKESTVSFISTETEIQEYDFYYYEGDDLIAVTHYEEDIGWGEADFRVLNTSTNTSIDLAIEVINNEGKIIPLTIELYSVNDDGSPGTNKEITIQAKPGRKIYYVEDFEIDESEYLDDIAIIASYRGVSILAQHNSLVTFSKEETLNVLPRSPGEQILTEIAHTLTGEERPIKEESKLKSSTVVGVTIAVILFILMGVVAYYLFKND